MRETTLTRGEREIEQALLKGEYVRVGKAEFVEIT